jgi:hypothetical protein
MERPFGDYPNMLRRNIIALIVSADFGIEQAQPREQLSVWW